MGDHIKIQEKQDQRENVESVKDDFESSDEWHVRYSKTWALEKTRRNVEIEMLNS